MLSGTLPPRKKSAAKDGSKGQQATRDLVWACVLVGGCALLWKALSRLRKQRQIQDCMDCTQDQERERWQEALPASAGQCQGCEVFISHRGADKATQTNIKRTFVSFLHARLQQAGIRTFMDQKSLKSGEQAWETMLEAVRACSIAIPVLSESYGNSIWCLRELTTMVAAKRCIMPLFLDATGVDVLQKIRAGSRKLKDHPEAEPGECDRWQTAISAVENLSGWEDEKYSCHASLVTSIVERIANQLDRQPLLVATWPIAMEQRLQPIWQAFLQHDVVGLYGMGGIGKTTAANAVFNQLKRQFKKGSCCYVEVGQLSDATTIERKQQQVLKELCDPAAHIDGVQQKRAELQERLIMRDVLLVLDDVWASEQLENLLVKLGPQSKVLVTSRDLGLMQQFLPELSNKPPQYVEMGQLCAEDSQRLLCLHAFGCDEAPSNLAALVELAAQACSGLPLTLRVAGSYLSVYPDPEAWSRVVDQLSRAQELDSCAKGSIFHRLRVSYDVLDDNTKALLLDIACILLGQAALIAAHVWAGAASLGLENLRNLSLITVKEGVLGMHDQIRDMLRSLAGEASSDRHAGWYVWDERAADICNPQQVRGFAAADNIMQGCLEGMPLLRLLHMSRESGVTWTPEDARQGSRGDVTQKIVLMRKLRYLQTSDLLLVGRLHAPKLAVLRVLEHPSQECPGMPDTLEQFSHLRFLDLRDCKMLQYLPSSIGKLLHLEVLQLDGCSRLQELPDSVCQLSRLKYLHLFCCGSLAALPVQIGLLGQLRHLDLCCCSCLTWLPMSVWQLSSLNWLSLSCCRELKSLPEPLNGLSNLRHLDMWECKSLSSLPEAFGHLSNLEWLCLGGSSLESLPESWTQLRSLKHLWIEGCDNLPALPHCTGQLSRLGALSLINCCSFQMLPPSLIESHSLKDMSLRGCTALECIPPSIVLASSLQQLDLSSCSSLRSLPPSMGQLQYLTQLSMEGCCSLESLPLSLSECIGLEDLSMRGCTALETLPSSIMLPSSLQQLNFSSCSSLTSLPLSMGQLQNLTQLKMEDCCSCRELPLSLSQCHSLKDLSMHGCTALETLPTGIMLPSSLQQLDLSWCSSLTSIPTSMGQLQNLQQLWFRECGSLERLPDSLAELGSLTILHLDGCARLKDLPEMVGQLSSLRNLKLHSCCALQSLPTSFFQFTWLQELQLRRCESLARLPSQLGLLTGLAALDCSHCKALCELPGELGRLTRLRHLRLHHCDALPQLPDQLCSLGSLQLLDISHCKSLERLPPGLSQLRSLQLKISHWPFSASLPTDFADRIVQEKQVYTTYADEVHGPWVEDTRYYNLQEPPASLDGVGSLSPLVLMLNELTWFDINADFMEVDMGAYQCSCRWRMESPATNPLCQVTAAWSGGDHHSLSCNLALSSDTMDPSSSWQLSELGKVEVAEQGTVHLKIFNYDHDKVKSNISIDALMLTKLPEGSASDVDVVRLGQH